MWPTGQANDGPYFRWPQGQPWPKGWKPDGCSLPPGVHLSYMHELNPVCIAHDICYHCIGTPGWNLNDKYKCDNIMRALGHSICSAVFPDCTPFEWLIGTITCNRYNCGRTVDIMYTCLSMNNWVSPTTTSINCRNDNMPIEFTLKAFKMGGTSPGNGARN